MIREMTKTTNAILIDAFSLPENSNISFSYFGYFGMISSLNFFLLNKYEGGKSTLPSTNFLYNFKSFILKNRFTTRSPMKTLVATKIIFSNILYKLECKIKPF